MSLRRTAAARCAGPTIRLTIAAATPRAPEIRNAGSYVPSHERVKPAPQAAKAAPSWCEQNTQAKTTPTRSGPAILRQSAIVGGTVATQSRPSKITNAARPDAGRAERRVQPEQRDAAQAVVPEQEPARVVAVGQPARRDRADDVEHADRGEQAGALHLREPVVRAGGDEVRADQAVRGRAADEEREHEQLEVTPRRELPQRRDGVAERVRDAAAPAARGSVAP